MPEVFSLPSSLPPPKNAGLNLKNTSSQDRSKRSTVGTMTLLYPFSFDKPCSLQSTGAPHHPLMDDPTSRSEKTEITRQNLTFPPPNLPVAAPCTLPSQSNFSIFNMYFISPPWFQGLLLQLFPCSCNINFSPSTNSFSISTQTCSSTSYLRGEKKTSLDSPNISMCNIFLIHFVLT